MIIDDKTFAEIVSYCKRASVAFLSAAESIRELLDGNPADEHHWTHALENLNATNEEMGVLGDTLKAVFLANEEERQHRSSIVQ